MSKSRLFSKLGAVNRHLIVLSIWKGLEPEHADIATTYKSYLNDDLDREECIVNVDWPFVSKSIKSLDKNLLMSELCWVTELSYSILD